MALSINEVEAWLASNARFVRGPLAAAILSVFQIDFAQSVLAEHIAVVANLALEFTEILVAPFNIVGGYADISWVGH